MDVLRKILSFITYLESFSKDERERKAREEEAAYHFVWVMRQREKERLLVVQKKKELQSLIEEGNLDVQLVKALRNEIHLKERLINSKVMEIEKTDYNAWSIEGYEKEQVERQAIHQARIEINNLEREGKIDSEKALALTKGLQDREAIMDKMVARLPRFPMNHQ
jgi:hypothetical protein